MKMKYFRFLYAETGRCFMHFGEIRDTSTEETFSFLYLRENSRQVNQAGTGHRPFLCPKSLDLVVLGRANENTKEALKGILQDTAVHTLVVPAKTDAVIPDEMPGIKEVVRVSETVEFFMTRAGWSLLAKPYGDGSVALAHSLAKESDGNSFVELAHSLAKESGEDGAEARRSLARTSGEGGLPGLEGTFEDCVMSVKVMEEDKRCCSEAEPDGYGCALGCTLRQDYDVCRYQQKGGALPYFTGTVLLAEGVSEEGCRDLAKTMEGRVAGIRFFGIPDCAPEQSAAVNPDQMSEAERDAASSLQTECISVSRAAEILSGESEGAFSESGKHKKYFVGTEETLDDETIAGIARSGLYHSVAALKTGEGLCCSGLLKYAE